MSAELGIVSKRRVVGGQGGGGSKQYHARSNITHRNDIMRMVLIGGMVSNSAIWSVKQLPSNQANMASTNMGVSEALGW